MHGFSASDYRKNDAFGLIWITTSAMSRRRDLSLL
jgi:hypothetical protein